MPKGIKIVDLKIGDGLQVTKGNIVTVYVRMFLDNGFEVYNSFTDNRQINIDLRYREEIAGIRLGIVGMRVGGRRKLVISPHLAYGAKGLPNKIPSNAVVNCEVELLKVRDNATPRKPEDFPPGKSLLIHHSGEAARNLPRWQFSLHEDGRCGAMIEYPIPGLTWRYVRRKNIDIKLDKTAVQDMFESVSEFPKQFPKDYFKYEELWADTTEKANSITRDRYKNSLCLSIYIYERGQQICHFGVSEFNQAMLNSKFYKVINDFLVPQLASGEKVEIVKRQ
jgi:hypothetical protein